MSSDVFPKKNWYRSTAANYSARWSSFSPFTPTFHGLPEMQCRSHVTDSIIPNKMASCWQRTTHHTGSFVVRTVRSQAHDKMLHWGISLISLENPSKARPSLRERIAVCLASALQQAGLENTCRHGTRAVPSDFGYRCPVSLSSCLFYKIFQPCRSSACVY